MNTLGTEAAGAQHVTFSEDAMTVQLRDGRTLSVPLEWFPTLRTATAAQRKHWRLIGGGVGIHWPDLDEDISVAGLLMPATTLRRAPARHPASTSKTARKPAGTATTKSKTSKK